LGKPNRNEEKRSVEKRMENRKDRKGRTIKEEQRALSRREGRQQGRNEKQTTFCSLPYQVAYTVHLLKTFLNFLKYHHSATFRYRIATSIALYHV